MTTLTMSSAREDNKQFSASDIIARALALCNERKLIVPEEQLRNLQQSQNQHATAARYVVDSEFTIPPCDIAVIATDATAVLRATDGVRSLVVLVHGGATTLVTDGHTACAVFLEHGATIDWIDASVGSTQSDHAVYLCGVGAKAKYRSIGLCTGDERYAASATMMHEAPKTSSKMLTRVALLDASQGRYRGLIKIARDAHGCEAYQREDTLLLGDKSRMDARPDLEIHNDDVKCSHGVTVGRVDQERLFYLRSKGIDATQAITLFVQGFFDQVLSSLGEYGADVRNAMDNRLHDGELYLDGAPIYEQFPFRMKHQGLSNDALPSSPAARRPLIYLDSAATTQKPAIVIDGMKRFYETSYANVHRGIYPLAERATAAFEHARGIVAAFLNAQQEEIIFTRSTTDGVNMLARMLESTLHAGDEIVVTVAEHHSNFVPWQELAKRTGCTLKTIPLTPDYRLDMLHARSLITNRTKIVAVAHVSNVLGCVNPIAQIARLAHEHGAVLVVDGAQAVAHLPVDVKTLDVDFYAFSGHKVYGPEGIGVLYGKKEHLTRLPPVAFGGEMVDEVKLERSTWNELPYKFEPGTPDITQAVGLGIAITLLRRIGQDAVTRHEHTLVQHALHVLGQTPGVAIIGPTDDHERVGVISFTVEGLHPHDVAHALAQDSIAVRAGNHCTQPLHCALGLTATARMSIGLYTTRDDINRLVTGIVRAQKVLS